MFAAVLWGLTFALLGAHGADAQDGVPIAKDELPSFLGPVPADQFTWRVVQSIDFDVYHGDANPPLRGSVGFYVGGWPQDLGPSQMAFASRLGRFPVMWHRTVAADGSIAQEGGVALGGIINLKVHVWAEAPDANDLEKLLSVVGQLPIFSSGATPKRFEWLRDILIQEERIRHLIWIGWPIAVLAAAWFVDRLSRRRQSSTVLRLFRFAGVIALSLAATIGAGYLSRTVIDWLVITRAMFLFAGAAVVLVLVLLLASGLYFARRMRTSQT